MAQHVQNKSLSQPQRTSIQSISAFLVRNEFVIPLALFVVFLAFTLPGISWGAWHPDEIVTRSIKALHGEWKFSEINFDYPDLPQYVMYWLGKLVLAAGYGDPEVLLASRILSAVLAGLAIVLTYHTARQAGGSVAVAGLSGLFLLCVSEWVHNAHFAHNDTYVVFFTTLSILLLVRYHNEKQRGWFYAACLTVGMAASSKYIGGSLILALFGYFLFSQRENFRTNLFSIAETLFIGSALTFLGYAIGTPKALFWMTYYFKRVFAALQWQIEYGHTPGSVRGILGQYAVLFHGLGWVIFTLFAAGFVWVGYQILRSSWQPSLPQNRRDNVLALLMLALFALDLPMLVSYNYQFRYFLTILPLLAIFSAFFVERVYSRAIGSRQTLYPKLVIAGVALIAFVSLARLVSVALLFVHDSRAPAGAFLRTLPVDTSLEHTFYPPDIPSEHFAREHNYPLYFMRNLEDQPPTDKKYKFNIGEQGLDMRRTDYLVIDSFTADKFENPYTCSMMPVECDFFKQLAAGQSAHYKLLTEFSYHLPAFLPQLHVEYVNPTIRIYERTP